METKQLKLNLLCNPFEMTIFWVDGRFLCPDIFLNQEKFFVSGYETLNINDNEMETIVVNCPELKLTLSLSVEHNLQPVLINKINGKTEFILKLIDFKTPS